MSRTAQMALLTGKILPAVLTAQQAINLVASGASSPITTAAQSIGAASSGRTVFQLVHWTSGSPAQLLTSATIGGVAATIHVQKAGNVNSWFTGAAIISAQVPTGTTAATVLNFPASVGGYNVYIATYSCTGLLSLTPVDVALSLTLSFGTSGHTDNVDVVKDGILLTAVCLYWSATSTLTGVNRDYDLNGETRVRYYQGGSLSVTADEANHPVNISVSSSGGNAIMVSASFR